MADPGMDSILVVTAPGAAVDGPAGRPLSPRAGFGEAVLRTSELAVTEVQQNMRSFLAQLQQVFSVETAAEGDFRMETGEVSACVTAEGKVGLLGIGANVEGSATVKLVFKRK